MTLPCARGAFVNASVTTMESVLAFAVNVWSVTLNWIVGELLVVTGTVLEKLDGDRVQIDLDVRCGGEKVLLKARAVVQL